MPYVRQQKERSSKYTPCVFVGKRNDRQNIRRVCSSAKETIVTILAHLIFLVLWRLLSNLGGPLQGPPPGPWTITASRPLSVLLAMNSTSSDISSARKSGILRADCEKINKISKNIFR